MGTHDRTLDWKPLVRAALAWVAALGLLVPAAAAEVLITNMPGDDGTSTALNGSAGSLDSKAAGFTMPAAYYWLDQVVLRLTIYDAANLPVVRIFDNGTGSVPENALITLQNPALPVSVDNFSFTPPTPFMLEAGRTYWIVVHNGSSGGDEFIWLCNTNPEMPPTGIATNAGYLFDTGPPPPATVSPEYLNTYEVHGTLVAGAAATLYASEDSTDEIYTIDPATMTTTLIGSAGEGLSYTGMAWDSSTSTLYISDVHIPAGDYGLGTIDPATGAVTIIGSHVSSSNIWGLAYDSGHDVLYGADGDTAGLATVNRATGESTVIGLYGASQLISGLAYDPETDTLYGIDQTTLYTLDRASGAAAAVGSLGVSLGGGDVGIGLEIMADSGEMYAADNVTSELYLVDKATAAATVLGPMGIGVNGLACVTPPGFLFADGFESSNTSRWDVTAP